MAIHQDGDWAVMFNWSINEDGLYTEKELLVMILRSTSCMFAKGNSGCSVNWDENAEQKVLDRSFQQME